MRTIGVSAHGIRLPIISCGDPLADIVANSLNDALVSNNITLKSSDIIGVTEAIVAKSQGNFASIHDLAADVKNKFGDEPVGLVFPIFSRNRFINILKGIALGASKVICLLQYPQDEVGNPIMDVSMLDEIEDKLKDPMPAAEFKKLINNYVHPFTGVDYISLYEGVSDNVSVYLSRDARDILKLTPNVLVGEIHTRNRTKARLLAAGAKKVYTLSDILSESVNGSGFNPDYGVLGSNLSKDDSLKLFPRNSNEFVCDVRAKIEKLTGVAPEVLVYGDGAFKDPAVGIWELADPVVSPAYTERLGGQPNEIKLKFVAENVFGDLSSQEKQEAITKMIEEKKSHVNNFSEGTTPRKFADLVGSLCDLMSGSGDKGTPVVLIRDYFDDYSSK